MEWWTKGSRDQGGWDSVASGIVHESEKAPIALDENGIHKVIADFKAATIRAVKQGIRLWKFMRLTGIYCISFFLLYLMLERMYGGSFENRIRLTLEVLAVQSEWPIDLPLFVRISATDWADGGWKKNLYSFLYFKEKELI
jgi:2,4-dienoyl-CoA reductase-like NADH-dependent reductase (Old Yellow Enzyme family)